MYTNFYIKNGMPALTYGAINTEYNRLLGRVAVSRLSFKHINLLIFIYDQ